MKTSINIKDTPQTANANRYSRAASKCIKVASKMQDQHYDALTCISICTTEHSWYVFCFFRYGLGYVIVVAGNAIRPNKELNVCLCVSFYQSATKRDFFMFSETLTCKSITGRLSPVCIVGVQQDITAMTFVYSRKAIRIHISRSLSPSDPSLK